ncbi:zinc-dependent alcohol dehydrogenase [Glutamicibacter mysorens]|uniref:zinc-dependent alcohol dehydrogenase n=1 Tax=Glutamicibacter mysorens TaxID=257984 RepID=UPI0020C667F9|nr:zinc-binding dehydrogenase [Glutamicibacter mysorens]UTM45738.1 zinc-binding dehydrogenase [Glutamicibacter mysorens]
MLPPLVKAAVSSPDATTKVVQLDPAKAIDARGWLKVESSALCGTDIDLYQGGLPEPCVMGHHAVGSIVSLDDELAAAWGISVGDRVALEEYLPCGREDCHACTTPGLYRFCPQADLWKGQRRVGMIPVAEGSGLHGGNAEYMQLSTNTVLHKLPSDLGSNLAAWTQPLANAVDWVVNIGGAAAGSTVAILGPGYHGIAAVAAAKAIGASRIVVVGRSSATSTGRLAIARTMGAETLVNDDASALSDALSHFGDFDVIVDTVGLGSPAIECTARLRKLGRLVLAGLGKTPEETVNLKTLVRGAIGIVGVRGRAPKAVSQAIELLHAGNTGLELVPSVDVPLEGVSDLFASLLNRTGPISPHIVIRP